MYYVMQAECSTDGLSGPYPIYDLRWKSRSTELLGVLIDIKNLAINGVDPDGDEDRKFVAQKIQIRPVEPLNADAIDRANAMFAKLDKLGGYIRFVTTDRDQSITREALNAIKLLGDLLAIGKSILNKAFNEIHTGQDVSEHSVAFLDGWIGDCEAGFVKYFAEIEELTEEQAAEIEVFATEFKATLEDQLAERVEYLDLFAPMPRNQLPVTAIQLDLIQLRLTPAQLGELVVKANNAGVELVVLNECVWMYFDAHNKAIGML